MKVRPMEAEVFNANTQTDRQTNKQTDMTKLTVDFRNFVKATKAPFAVVEF
jgi:hypothetical protein